MSWMLSIDPGTRGLGAALWRDRKLVAAEYVRNPEKEGTGARECISMARATERWVLSDKGVVTTLYQFPDGRTELRYLDDLVVEWPQTYGGRASRGDTNSLFPLSGIDCALGVIFTNAKISQYVPHDWKGGIEKPDTVKEPYPIVGRVKDRLDAEEQSRVRWPGSIIHSWDVADAIGVGLKFLNRFERQRAFQ